MSGTSSNNSPSGRCFLLDCHEALPGIVAHLDGKELAALLSTCKIMRDMVDGEDGRRWWRRLCRNLLGKTVCAMHLQAAGGGGGGGGDAASSSSSSSAVVVPVPDSARFWRRLYRHALNADTFHWHAESSRRAWASVHAHDEARRHAAFTAAASAGVVGPYVGVVDGKEFHHENIRLGISGEWRYAPEAGRCTS